MTAPRGAAVAAATSVVLAASVAAVALTSLDTDVRPLVTLTVVSATAGVVLVGVSVVGRWPGVVVWGLAALGVAYAAAVSSAGGPLDVRAPVVGSALFLGAEAALWSHDLRRSPRWAAEAVAHMVGWLASVAVGSVAVGFALLAVGTVEPGWGLAAQTVGVVAAMGVAVTAIAAGRVRGGGAG